MRRLPLAAVAAALLCLISMVLAPSANAAPGKNPVVGHRNVRVCAAAPANQASCHAIRNDAVDANGNVVPDSAQGPAGYGPQELQDAYKIAGATSGGKTVAIVDAYDAASAYNDLTTYRSVMGLPPCADAAPVGQVPCFRKVNQSGQASPLPAPDGGWGQEISLDLDMVSATCPDCNILLVEANTASFANLAAAVQTAAKLGATAISNSYGGNDTNSYASSYTIPGVAVTASSGDNGYGVEAPASFPGVVAVGGTSLTPAPSTARHYTETAWNGAGSGCSRWNSTTWQNTRLTGCTHKATADVAAVADPNTGVAVYDSTPYGGASGWLVFGGTSVASPIIASVYALAGHYDQATSAGYYTWHNYTGNVFDVTSGSNGRCTTKKWCTAGAGWDGPTGLGTPNGLGAF